MSWSKLAPIAKSTGRPMASAAIVSNKSSGLKISVIFSASLLSEFGDRAQCDVSAGGGEHEGSLLIEFVEDGPFKISLFGKGGGRLFVPLTPAMAQQAAGQTWTNQPCRLGDRTADSLVLHLPVAGWFGGPRGAAPKSPAPVPAPAPADAARRPEPEEVEDDRLDVVAYLKAKGLSVQRLAAGRFMLSGQTTTLSGMLKQVNQIRDNAGLDPLPLAKVR